MYDAYDDDWDDAYNDDDCDDDDDDYDDDDCDDCDDDDCDDDLSAATAAVATAQEEEHQPWSSIREIRPGHSWVGDNRDAFMSVIIVMLS